MRDIIRQAARNAISFHPALHPLNRYQFITLRDHLVLPLHLGIFLDIFLSVMSKIPWILRLKSCIMHSVEGIFSHGVMLTLRFANSQEKGEEVVSRIHATKFNSFR